MDSTSAPQKRGLPAWAKGLIVLGIVAAISAALAVFLHNVQVSGRKTTCMVHMVNLGACFAQRRGVNGPTNAARWSGAALWLSLRKDGDPRRRLAERYLFCPLDVDGHYPESEADRRAYDNVDLEHPPRNMCSYPGRDFAAFPPSSDADAYHVLGACLRHKGGAIVLFDDGDVRWFTLAELGLSSDDEKTVGPNSKSHLLRALRYDGDPR